MFSSLSFSPFRLPNSSPSSSPPLSSSLFNHPSLSSYSLRPPIKALFFDCDDCLYFDSWLLASRLTSRIEEWCVKEKDLPKGEAYNLYKKHGTALRGLLRENILENTPEAIDGYLEYAHDVQQETLARNEPLRELLLSLDRTIPRFVFTASVKGEWRVESEVEVWVGGSLCPPHSNYRLSCFVFLFLLTYRFLLSLLFPPFSSFLILSLQRSTLDHAEKCLKAIGIADLFDGIIDTKTCGFETKHSKKSFQAALEFANLKEEDSAGCVLFDDSVKNIAQAKAMGWRGVLVGMVGRDDGERVACDDCEAAVERIEDIRSVMPEIFP